MPAGADPHFPIRPGISAYVVLACFALAGVMAVPTGCTYDVEFPEGLCDTTQAVTFSGDVRPIIEANCAISGCHVPGGEGNGDFTTYAGLHARVDDGSLLPSIQRLPGATFMPPYADKLPDCDISKIKRWVEAGAPNN